MVALEGFLEIPICKLAKDAEKKTHQKLICHRKIWRDVFSYCFVKLPILVRFSTSLSKGFSYLDRT